MKTAYPSTREPVVITLYRNVPFDNTYKHHTIISELFKYNNNNIYNASDIACERFINMRYPSDDAVFPHTTLRSGNNDAEFNFEFSNGLITSVTLELTNEWTNSNYLVVKTSTLSRVGYYYFITGITQVNFNTYKLNLELDVLMTYQDEFLQGMKDVPVFTERKHCHRYTNDGLIPYCADFKTGDSTFNGVKPNIIKDEIPLHYRETDMKKMEGILWLYVCLDLGDTSDLHNIEPLYTLNNKTYPLLMLAMPLNVSVLTYQSIDGTKSVTYTKQQMITALTLLINDGHIHGCKVSPYPPFSKKLVASNVLIDKTGSTLPALTIKSSTVYATGDPSVIETFTIVLDNNKIYTCKYTGGLIFGSTLFDLLCHGFVLIAQQNDYSYQFDDLSPQRISYSTTNKLYNTTKPTITSNRYKDPKLCFSPFTKYYLSSQYATEGYEIFLDLEFSQYVVPSTLNASVIGFTSYATGYIGDNNFYTEVKSVLNYGSSSFKNYKYSKLGLASSINYDVPSGENALDVFNSTQKASFYQSKTASGITSGLTIAGGIGSIALGTAGLVGTLGFSSVASAGLIAGGVTAVAGGLASMANTIKSTNAKIEDLKNTPDTINISGSNFAFDDAILNDTNCLPYLLIYECDNTIMESADEYFYQYGYEVSRYCYFNTELSYDASTNKKIDNNLFGRTIFNYIQIKEDITNKINADIPLVAKQKLSSIFNNGITIWNFFGFDYLWTSSGMMYESNSYTKWFMKQTYDNTEYSITQYTE